MSTLTITECFNKEFPDIFHSVKVCKPFALLADGKVGQLEKCFCFIAIPFLIINFSSFPIKLQERKV